jgi:hypothetical protein
VNGRAAGTPDGATVWRGMFVAFAILFSTSTDAQSTVDVRYTEGLIRGFLVLRAMDGNVLAHGDLAQVPHGANVTSQLVLRFTDGSVYNETVDFSQRGSFQVLNYHLVQKGPVFKVPLEMTIEGSTGKVRVRYTDEDGDEKEAREQFELPPDLANGMIPVLLKNIPRDAKQTTVSLVAATPRPRLVTLVISREGEAKFLAGGVSHKATEYRIKVEIGGILGFLAPLVGKQPQDSHAGFWTVMLQPSSGWKARFSWADQAGGSSRPVLCGRGALTTRRPPPTTRAPGCRARPPTSRLRRREIPGFRARSLRPPVSAGLRPRHRRRPRCAREGCPR